MSPPAPPPTTRASRPATTARLAAALAIAWASLTALAWDLPLNNDIGWQYWVARQLLGGARFYRDIAESNPPLWFWEAMPMTLAAQVPGVAPTHLAVAATMARIVAVAGLVGAMTDRRAGLQRLGIVLLLVVPGAFSFGERDMLMAVGALPYAMLIARRSEGRAVPVALAVATAGLAGWGFAMKPHFLLVPLMLEGWLALRLRRRWRIVRVETVALALVAVVYALAIAIVTPAYLTDQLPLVLTAYGDFRPPFATLWTGQAYLPAWMLGAAAWATARRRGPRVDAAATTALACAAIYAAQGKGFAYHATPVTIAIAWTAWLLLEDQRRLLPRMLAWLTLAAVLGTALLVGPFRPARLGAITAAVERLPAGATFALVSAHSWDAFPLVEQHRLVWPMRGLLLWALPTVARSGPATPLARRVRAEVVADLWCHPPDAILFDDPRRSPAMPREGPGLDFDYRRFVLSDPAARALLSAYRQAARSGGATLWLRSRPVRPRGTACRAVSIRPPASATGWPLDAISLFRAPAPDRLRSASPPAG